MNNIVINQNSDRQIQRLAAQRQLYATAKKIFGFQVFVGAPLAVALAFISIFHPGIKSYSALWGIIVVIGDIIWLTPWTKRLREQAAKIQEQFDCEVLSLQWSDLKVGSKADPELIKEQADKYLKWKDSMPTLINWYDTRVAELPIHVARVICQRSNCWWDSKQRRRYAIAILFLVISVSLVIFCVALGRGFTIEDFILRVVAPLSPILLLGIRQHSEQSEAAIRSNLLKVHAESLWKNVLSGVSQSNAERQSRELQSEIFESRKKSPLVFDRIFKWLRNDYELQMNHAAAELVAEAKQRLKIK